MFRGKRRHQPARRKSVSEKRADIVKDAHSVSELSYRTAVLDPVQGVRRRAAIVIVAIVVIAVIVVVVIAVVVAIAVAAVPSAAQALR